MGFVVSDTGGGDFKQTPAGVHIGRCFKIVDLGTQVESYEGEEKLMQKVAIYWELTGEDEEGKPLMLDNGEPMVIWKEYTKSLGKKAALRAALESWRGKPFNDDELKGFDVSKLIGAYCMVNVTHKVSGQGKTYATVSSLTPLPAALRNAKPAPMLENVLFDLDNFSEKVFSTFHAKLQEKINASIERSGKNRQDAAQSRGHADRHIPDPQFSQKGGVIGNVHAKPAAPAPGFDDMADDIPFASPEMHHDMQPGTVRRMARYNYK